MCFMCDQDKSVLRESWWSGASGWTAPVPTHFSKMTTALATDGSLDSSTGLSEPADALPIADTIGDDPASASTLKVDGASVISTINTPGDHDFFRIELQAGVTYEIGQYMVKAGPTGVPLADAFLELYNSAGQLVMQKDDGGPNTPFGLDALITFTPTTSGTYYVNAMAFNDEVVGDYEVFARVSRYKPYYFAETETVDNPNTPQNDVGEVTINSSPLHSLDWGTQVDRTSRNPDGEEGPRVTGNEHIPTPTGKNVITVYFAKAGDVFVSQDPTNPGTTENIVAKGFSTWEKAAFYEALSKFSDVADIVYVEVEDRQEADFKFITYMGTPGYGPSLLGRMNPPNYGNEGQAEFNAADRRWTEAGLQPGAMSFVTLIHELGHGHGMAHPHDNGGRSSVMRFVTEADIVEGVPLPVGHPLVFTHGEADLNQGVYTMMSYQDGWEDAPWGVPASDAGYGFLGGLSAFDIAVIQDKYGVNEDFATGDDVYALKDENAPGTYYLAIWDAGGEDTIEYGGAKDAVIDLRAATLKYEPGGGGWISYAYGIHGGYTIANGVTIENATSGSGNDRLTGNDAGNRLLSGAGNDVIDGRGGDDFIVGGAGKDTLSGGSGNDTFRYAALADSAVGANRDVISDFARGDKIDLSAVGATTFIGGNIFSGRAGEVRAVTLTDQTIVEYDADGDARADMQIELSGSIVLDRLDFVSLNGAATSGDDELFGTSGSDTIDGLGGNDTIYGYAGSDILSGGDGDDVIVGGRGRDTLTGGAGSDLFALASLQDSTPGAGRDAILDFEQGADAIDLSALGLQWQFIGTSAFSGMGEQEIRYSTGFGSTFIEADFNGDAVADIQIELVGNIPLNSGDFFF